MKYETSDNCDSDPILLECKNVLIIIDSLGYGGAERLLVSLLKYIHNIKNIKVDVVTLYRDSSLKPELTMMGINVIELNIKNRWSLFITTNKIRNILDGDNYDVIWGNLFFGNIYTALVKYFFPNIKTIWTLHSAGTSDGYNLSFRQLMSHKVRSLLELYLGNKFVDTMVAVSQSVAVEYTKRNKWRNIEIIYNGVDFLNFPSPIDNQKKSKIRKQYEVCDKDFLIVTPGRYAPEKGHSVIIDALDILKSKYNLNIFWIAVGSGELKKDIQKILLTRGLNNRTKLLDSVQHSILLRLMQSSDLVVIPSIREPFGIAAVESMGLGVPTVTSYVDGLIEVVGSSDPIDDIDPGDDIKLADTIALLASDSLLRGKLIEVRSKRVRELFDIQRAASKWVDILWE